MTDTLQREFEQYLARPIDYSSGYTESVAALGKAIVAKCGLTLRHVKDMNYSAGQTLILTQADTDDRAIRVYVSSKGPLFALVPFQKERDGWHAFSESLAVDTPLAHAISGVREVLSQHNLREVDQRYWALPVPGRTTEMDAAPATLFDVLFSEIQ